MDSSEQFEGLTDYVDVGNERKRGAKDARQPSGQNNGKDAAVCSTDGKSKERTGAEEYDWALLLQTCEIRGVLAGEGRVNEIASQIFDSERPEAGM